MSRRQNRARTIAQPSHTRVDGPRLIVDGWIDTVRGFGDADSTTQGFQKRDELPADVLEALYEQSWLARTIVQALPEDAMRRRPSGPTPEQWARFDELNRHEAYEQGVLMQGLCQGRTFGGAAILLGFAQGSPTEEAPEPGPGADLVWLDSVPWGSLTVVARETDANSPRFGLPLVLRVSGDHPRMGLEFHVSRSILCGGAPRACTRRQQNPPWLSVLQAVYEELLAYGMNWKSVDALLAEASMGVFKMAGLAAAAARENEAGFRARLALLSTGKSTARTIFLDASAQEEFSRTEVSFAGLYQIVDKIMMRVAGAARMPLTRLFGREPAGMNATGESDLSQWYDSCESYREQSVAPKFGRLIDLVAGTHVELEWPSLWQASAKEQAETRNMLLAGDAILVDKGMVDPLSVLESRAKDKTLGLEVDVAVELRLAEEAAAQEEAAREAGLAALAQKPAEPADVDVEGE
jgi:hypothetical protein